MTQPPRSSDGQSMRRFALFVAAFVIIVSIGVAQPSDKSSKESICVCIPSRAGLLLKSAIVKTQVRTTALFTQ